MFGNNAFDISHSNSVIEHVGSYEKMKDMANELRRVATHFFVQTPNYWFPIEPHFVLPLFQFLPRPIQNRWLQKKYGLTLEGAVRRNESIRLLTVREIRSLFPEGDILIENVMMFPKSIMARSKIVVS